MALVEPQEWKKKVDQITAKAWNDDAFKKRLLSDPVAVLKSYGLDVPAAVKVKIVEDTDTLLHLSLPPKPSDKELSEEDLAAVAAGAAANRSCRTQDTGL